MTLLFAFFVSYFSSAAEYVGPEVFEKDSSPWKALVFLSEACPCSRSHIIHLNDLQKKYPGLKVYGVISEPAQDEDGRHKIDDYFHADIFQFPIINEPSQSLVKRYKALKTPHVSLLQKNASGGYEVIYEGGVTNQKDFAKSTVKYLAENMAEISQGKPVKYKNGQSLGCYIRRL